MVSYRLLAALTFLTALPAAYGYAVTMPAGCAMDTTGTPKHTFFVDPVNGNDTVGVGSEERPYKSLSYVLAHYVQYKTATGLVKNAAAPVHAGDRLILLPGDHGSVTLNGMFNDDYILIDGSSTGHGNTSRAPQNRAVLHGVTINGGSKWAFSGMRFLATPNTKPTSEADALVKVLGTGSKDFIFSGSIFATTDDVSTWSKADWVSKNFGGIRTTASCSMVFQSQFYHLRNAISISGDNTQLLQNKIHDFGNDAVEFVGSNLVLRENVITDGHHSPLDPLHSDGMQGFPAAVTSKNIVIDANTIINSSTDPDNYLQGISAFDGTWDGLRITNNVVITNAYHGITFYGAKNVKILNNTVLASSDPAKIGLWINIAPAKDGTPSENVLVRNNIASVLGSITGKNVVEDHNLALQSMTLDGKYIGKEGVYGDNNRLFKNEFAVFNSVHRDLGTFDLHLKAGSPGLQTGGSTAGMQLGWDHDNLRRKSPVTDLGAYQGTF